MFSQRLPIGFLLLLLIQSTYPCTSGGLSTKTYQNPTIQLKFYAPVKWTYPLDTSPQDLSYFPEQPLTQLAAQNNGINDLQNAIIGALVDNQYDINLVKATAQYTAPQVNDCAKLQSNTAPLIFYIVEDGAVTKKVGGITQALDGDNCIGRKLPTTVTYEDFPIQASIKIDGLTVRDDQMTAIINAFITKLSFSNNVKFIDRPLAT